MNHLIVEKIIIIFLLILWGFDTFRTRKRKRYDPAIEAADASETPSMALSEMGVSDHTGGSGSVYRRAVDSGFTEIEGRDRRSG